MKQNIALSGSSRKNVSPQGHRQWLRKRLLRSIGAGIFCLGIAAISAVLVDTPHSAQAQQPPVVHYNNGLGRTPALGWSSWTYFRKDISESIIKAQADALHTKLQSHGFVYVNVDDGWQIAPASDCDAFGRFKVDPAKFPNGIKPVADYVHSLGLKFGLYVTPGVPNSAYDKNSPIEGTSYHVRDIVKMPLKNALPDVLSPCQYDIDFSKPGAKEFIQSWANQFASWGVDYVKMDFISVGFDAKGNTDNAKFWSAALLQTGRPIYFTLCNNLQLQDVFGQWWASWSNGWRGPNGDIERDNGLSFILPATDWSHVSSRLSTTTYNYLAGPGGWNDLDSLMIGYGSPARTGLTEGEKRLHMGFWVMQCSPLLVGTDMTNMDAADLAWLQNDEIIGINQTPVVATPHNLNSSWQWYSKQLADGSYAVLMLCKNNSTEVKPIAVNWQADLGFSGSARVKNLFSNTDLGVVASGISYNFGGHDALLFKVTPTSATPTAPVAPTGIAASAGNTQIALSWGNVVNASSYNLYRATTTNGQGTTPYRTNLTNTSFTDTGLTNGTAYFYKVTAVNSIGESPRSAEASATPQGSGGPVVPSAPTGVTASAGNAQAILSWGAVSGATSYSIFRGTTSGGQAATPVASGITATTYTNTGLTNGTTYYYYVKAVNSAGASAPSLEVSARPMAPTTVPSAPTGLAASAGDAQVSLTWNASSGATSYSIFRGTTANGQATTPIATGITSTNYVNTGLTNGTTYYYKVKAVNSAGSSAYSNEANAKPVAPSGNGINLSASLVAGQVRLTWTANVPNVAYFTVYRGTTSGGQGTTPLDYPSASPWTDNFAPNSGTRYYYVLRAVDIYGNTSALSNEVSIVP